MRSLGENINLPESVFFILYFDRERCKVIHRQCLNFGSKETISSNSLQGTWSPEMITGYLSRLLETGSQKLHFEFDKNPAICVMVLISSENSQSKNFFQVRVIKVLFNSVLNIIANIIIIVPEARCG